MRKILVVVAMVGLFVGCSKDQEASSSNTPKPKVEAAKTAPKTAAPDTKAPPKADPALIKRGEYIANVTGCAICHTPVGPKGPIMSKAWAGGLEITEAFGTWRSPNITQDRKTGIGAWTDKQIIDSVREGKKPNGDLIYPIMPSGFYNAMSDADAKALVAFLRALPAIENQVEGNKDLKLPKAELPKAAGKEAPAEKRGEYLAGLMHCVMCHTPMGKAGPDMSKAFAGGFEFELPPAMGTGKLYSSNITSDKKTGIGKWTKQQIIDSIVKMKRPDGKPILPPMMMYVGGWSKITPEDADAIASFIQTIPPTKNKVAASTFKPAGPPPGGPPAAAKAADKQK